MNFMRWIWLIIVSLTVSCASSPARYHTLVPEAANERPASRTAGFRVEVEPVKVPAQVDRMELVTRLADGGIAIADDERWIAPLPDELQNALSVELSRRLGPADPAESSALQMVSIQMEVERFESAPSRYALIEASWSIRLKTTPKDVLITRRTRAFEEVSAGYPQLVRGHQRAIALIAEEIATAAQASASAVAACTARESTACRPARAACVNQTASIIK
jgi:uncharacterized protein